MLNIEIDGRKLQVEEGSMVIEAADAAGIYIPRFCYHDKLSVAANCRMCLVDIEKVAKPLPACATPVTEGMRVFTHSEKTVTAQRGVMEFLLINHPLDCPICDQGGECELQDLAVGYGRDISRYSEKKRIVKDEDIGPLIATDMTRCIHCTRCVRFGQEIAGIMELGATGRGEHMRIGTYIQSSVVSELSGNMIDLCPVGALTSKPFRYSARTWELQDHASVSPHDCIGSNLTVQVLRGRVRRVLPRANEQVNEVWLSDRDRFSYTALEGDDRLKVPRIKVNGVWQDTDWTTALESVVNGLRGVLETHGAGMLGALGAPQSTLEELYLLQRFVRGLGSPHVDHRLRQYDFRDDAHAPLYPSLGMSLADLETLETVLLVGSNVRKDQPLIAHRLRKAFLDGARILAVNGLDYSFTFDLYGKSVTPPAGMLDSLVAVMKEVNRQSGAPVPDALKEWAIAVDPTPAHVRMAEALVHGKRKAILLGNEAFSHPQFADLRALAGLLGQMVGATLGYLTEGAGAGGWIAGCLPHRDLQGAAAALGLNAYEMVRAPRRGYILLGTEPELDCWDGALARKALEQAEFVVSLTSFASATESYAHVQLPAAAFTETEGTFVNCEGRWQQFEAATSPPGDARPAWKILRVLGGMMKLPGFTFTSIEGVRDALGPVTARPETALTVGRIPERGTGATSLIRISDVPMYVSDPVVRRAEPLQASPDNPKPALRVSAREALRLGLVAGQVVRVAIQDGRALLGVVIDERVPAGCALIPWGYRETAPLAPFAAVTLEPVS